MLSRQKHISRAITRAILNSVHKGSKSVAGRILALFSLLQITLIRFEDALFTKLRTEIWQVDEEEYKDSFAEAHSQGGLKGVGDLGYSGSVFFTTPDGKFLVKSLNRAFEYEHFEQDMLRPYAAHMRAHSAESLLVRITDYLTTKYSTTGTVLNITPPRYMVMENLLGGKDADPQRGKEWESYDLKPSDYFFPERDIANGALAPQSVKDKLIDKYEDKIRITQQQYEELRRVLEADTGLLEATNCVDYSLFLVRYPADQTKTVPVKSNRTEWRQGVESTDGKWRYRLILLDFFFAKHRLQPKLMTALIDAFNIVGRKGPMSITTTPTEYRQRFLKMVDELVEAE